MPDLDARCRMRMRNAGGISDPSGISHPHPASGIEIRHPASRSGIRHRDPASGIEIRHPASRPGIRHRDNRLLV